MYKVFGSALIALILGSGSLHAQSVPGAQQTPSAVTSAIRPVWEGQPGFSPGEQYYNPNREALGVYRPNERS